MFLKLYIKVKVVVVIRGIQPSLDVLTLIYLWLTKENAFYMDIHKINLQILFDSDKVNISKT